jgi:hypothetical protein
MQNTALTTGGTTSEKSTISEMYSTNTGPVGGHDIDPQIWKQKMFMFQLQNVVKCYNESF